MDTKVTTATKTDRISADNNRGRGYNRTTGMTRGMDSKTGMKITDLTREDDQTNTNTTRTNQKHR